MEKKSVLHFNVSIFLIHNKKIMRIDKLYLKYQG